MGLSPRGHGNGIGGLSATAVGTAVGIGVAPNPRGRRRPPRGLGHPGRYGVALAGADGGEAGGAAGARCLRGRGVERATAPTRAASVTRRPMISGHRRRTCSPPMSPRAIRSRRHPAYCSPSVLLIKGRWRPPTRDHLWQQVRAPRHPLLCAAKTSWPGRQLIIIRCARSNSDEVNIRHYVFSVGTSDAHPPTLCLSMIVKNEVATLPRLFESCRELVAYWVICDTGSTDGTQELIRQHPR
jgi:hypothetical protein